MVLVANGFFFSTIAQPINWTHVIINYIGPEDGQGIRIHSEGIEAGSGTTRYPRTSDDDGGDGRIVIGESHSVQLDELIFFNSALTDSEIKMLSHF